MHWFGGNIAEAVTISKQKNAIFVVFVEGDNEQTSEMTTMLNHSAVTKRLSNEKNFLAVKLQSGSVNYTHFAQIYQFVPVPSLFFIGRNGTPLEVVCPGIEPENLASRIDRILEEHYKEAGDPISVMQPSTSSQNIKKQTTDLLQAEASSNVSSVSTKSSVVSKAVSDSLEPAAKVQKTMHHEVTKSGQEYEVVCDNDVCVRVPKVKSDDAGPSQPQAASPDSLQQATVAVDTTGSEISLEEKMEKAKELIEARRREKVEKEKEEERRKELERRSTGYGVAELKKWQAEQELKQLQEERKREKMENNLARQRILEQIAQDRAERKARETSQTTQPVQEPQMSPTSGDTNTRARVQFKMPDGSSHTAHFEADGTLRDVQRYVAENLQMSTSSFSLWMAFPRRELTENDATLRELQIAPSAALLVIPRHTSSAVDNPSVMAIIISYFTQFLATYILTPSHQVYEWIRIRLFPAPADTPSSPSPPRASPPPPSPPSDLRRRGNIHRLPGERSGDDDNNTWNGNSTQQM